MMTPFQDYPHGITCIDTGYIRPGFAASYLLIEEGEAVFIETGPQHAIPRLLTVLEQKNLTPDAVKAVIVTHIHLDHAGGAGALLNHLPCAALLVHPRGVRHLLHPEKLQASAEMVYGKARFLELLGGISPADPHRTRATEDNETFQLNKRSLTLLHTPGHARHHQCVWDKTSGGLFSGDAFGISYPIFAHGTERLIFPSTTPTQFDPEASHHTLDRLAALQPNWLFLTHFGRMGFTQALTTQLHNWLQSFVTLAQNQEPQEIQNLLYHALKKAGITLRAEEIEAWLTPDCTINAQGLKYWWESQVF